MPDIVFDCTHCGTELIVDDEGMGMEIPCPKCSKTILIPEQSKPAAPESGRAPAEPYAPAAKEDPPTQGAPAQGASAHQGEPGREESRKPETLPAKGDPPGWAAKPRASKNKPGEIFERTDKIDPIDHGDPGRHGGKKSGRDEEREQRKRMHEERDAARRKRVEKDFVELGSEASRLSAASRRPGRNSGSMGLARLAVYTLVGAFLLYAVTYHFSEVRASAVGF